MKVQKDWRIVRSRGLDGAIHRNVHLVQFLVQYVALPVMMCSTVTITDTATNWCTDYDDSN